MRWDTIETQDAQEGSQAALFPASDALLAPPTPDFHGITFHEVAAKSVLNRVPTSSKVPFPWTINPYRGCSHACVYCFARSTHTYLDFDAGNDFNTQVVVKVNTVEVLQRELAKPSWGREVVAMGTNTDPYQRAEGRYKIMPGVIRALADSGTPFSILTKGTLLARDLPLIKAAASRVNVSIGMSLALTDGELQSTLEPGTPSPRARLALLERLSEAGVTCNVMAMPILPWLTDSEEALTDLLTRLKNAGANSVTVGTLHLRPGAREWFFEWLGRERADLVPHYRKLYGKSSYAPKDYRTWLSHRVRTIKRRIGFAGSPSPTGANPSGWRMLDGMPTPSAPAAADERESAAAAALPLF